MAKEVNLDAFADRIAEKLLAAKQQANDAGQNVGEEFIEGVVKGIKEHSKDAKSEIAKLFEDFNKTTNNFKSRKTISNSEWTRVLGMSRELLKSERYADSVRDKLSDIAVTFKNIGKVSGLDKILEEIDRAENKIQSVSWVEAGKNYKKKKSVAQKPASESHVKPADPTPVIKAEKKKQQAIKQTAGEYHASAEAAEEEAKLTKEIFSRISKNSSIKGLTNLEEEAVNVTRVLAEMYDAGIRDTEKYITLQYKLSKILDKMVDSYGGVKASGAQDLVELRSWIFDRIQQVTGTNIFDISGVMENLLGDSDFSLFNKSLSGLGMKHVADLLRMNGTYGDWTEAQAKLEDETKATNVTIEDQVDVLRKEEKAVNGVVEAQKKLSATQNSDTNPTAVSSTIQSYKELKNILEECERLASQMEEHKTPEIINTVESMAFKPLNTNYLMDEDKYVSIITEAWNEYKKLEGSVESTDEVLIKAEKTVTSLAVSYARAHKNLSAFNNEELEAFTRNKHSEYERAKHQEQYEWGLNGTKTKANEELFNAMKVMRGKLLFNDKGSQIFPKDVHDQLLDAINQVILKGGKANDVLETMAKLMGLAADEASQATGLNTKDNVVESNQRKIASYQDLLSVLQEYFNLTEKITRSKLDGTFVDEFEKNMPDYSASDLDDPTKRLAEIKAEFKKTYQMLSGMKRAYKDGIDFVDNDNMRIHHERLGEEIDYTTTRLAAMARVYMDLGGSIDDFNKSQQKVVMPKLTRYDKDSAAFEAEAIELEKINAPIEAAQNKIRELLQSMLPTLDDSEKLAQMMTGRGPWGTFTETISRLNANAGIFDMIEPERAAKALASVFGFEIPQAIEKAEVAQAEFTEETKETTDAQNKLKESAKDTSDVIYHAGDLSNVSGTLKSFPLGNVPPTRSNGIGGLTGLYTTDELDGFIGNEWQGAPISTIDPSGYNLLKVRTNDIADKIGGFLNDVNATIYGYYNAIDENDWEMKRYTDVKSVDELYEAHRELFKESSLTFEQFTQFINNSKEKIAGKSFADIELPAIDEGIAKSGISSAMQDVADEVFNSDSFQTQLLKMLGYEGVDLRGTKYNGTYTGGSVIFDVKPESIKSTNEKWSDVMLRNGFEVTEDDLKYEEKRRQLAFDTAKAYSQQSDATKEVVSVQKQLDSSSEAAVADELKDTFEVIQKGESITGKFVTTANTVQEALQKMRQSLPEEQQGWTSYIDDVANREDDKLIGAFKSVAGSMGDYSEQYKFESLGGGRVAITFSGIRGELEATADVAKSSNQVLIENENKYQQELEETTKIQQERKAQAEVYTEAAQNLLSSGYESISEGNQIGLMVEFGNKIYTEGMSAAEAMDQLYASLERLRAEAVSMPDDIIDNFGADSEKVQETVSQLQKLSSIDATRIFDSVDLKGFLEAFNIDNSNFAIFRTLFEELMQITKAMSDGVDVGNAFNLKMEEITNTIMKLGGHMVGLDDADYATMLQKFYKHMSGVKVQFNDKIKADYTKDQWKSLYNTYKNRLTSDLTKGIPADTLYGELSSPEMFASLFDSDVWDQQGQFKLIFEKLDEARQLQANNWKTLQGFVSSDRDGIQSDVDDIYNQMGKALFADSSAQQLDAEADALKDVEQSATKAANSKRKFSKENKKLGEGAAESANHLDDEVDNLDEVNRAASQMPDMSAYDSTSARLDADGNPYIVSGAARTEMEDGLHYRTTDTYQFDAENNRWDLLGSVQSSERTREMVQALQEYYKILNKVQKLRLDPSNAIHAEEINKLETEDLVRAYQRVSDLGVQVNDIEGQINLSVNQRQALLDVELRARQEMYDVIAKMEDKQATTSVKPYQKTVADELKKSSKIDSDVRLLGEGNVSTTLQSQVTQYRQLVDELVDLRLQLARDPELTNDADFSNRFTDTANRAERARVAIEGVFKESQRLGKIGRLIEVGDKDVSKLDNLKTAMVEFVNTTWNGEAKIQGFNKEGTQMYVTLDKGAGAVENITVALNKASGHLNAFTTGTSKATNEWEEFKKQAASGIARTAGMYLGFNDLIRYGRQGLEYVKEIDLAMTELKKVTDETNASYKEFLGDAGETAAVIGSTISDFTEASATFARLGYSLEESSSMAETAIIYKNVADGLDSVEESSESIISTMMAFGIEANDTMSIIDRFNAVGKICADYKVA